VIQIFWFRGLGNTIPGPDVVQEKVTIRVDATIEGFPEFALGNLSSQTVQTGESPCPILIQAPALIRQRRGSQNLPDIPAHAKLRVWLQNGHQKYLRRRSLRTHQGRNQDDGVEDNPDQLLRVSSITLSFHLLS
jgi:hypothetical protein